MAGFLKERWLKRMGHQPLENHLPPPHTQLWPTHQHWAAPRISEGFREGLWPLAVPYQVGPKKASKRSHLPRGPVPIFVSKIHLDPLDLDPLGPLHLTKCPSTSCEGLTCATASSESVERHSVRGEQANGMLFAARKCLVHLLVDVPEKR